MEVEGCLGGESPFFFPLDILQPSCMNQQQKFSFEFSKSQAVVLEMKQGLNAKKEDVCRRPRNQLRREREEWLENC